MKHNAVQSKCVAQVVRNMCETSANQQVLVALSRLSGQPCPFTKEEMKAQMDKLEAYLADMLTNLSHD